MFQALILHLTKASQIKVDRGSTCIETFEMINASYMKPNRSAENSTIYKS